MKLSRRAAKFLFAPTVALFMSGAMSFALTVIRQGIGEDFIYKWLISFGISFIVAVPIAWFVVPRVQKFYDRITEKPESDITENLDAAQNGARRI